MTTSHILNAVSPLIADLAQDLSERERLRRLLAALRNLLPADAVLEDTVSLTVTKNAPVKPAGE